MATCAQITIGDAIVWWRACAVWPANVPIRVACVLLLLATCGMTSLRLRIVYASLEFHSRGYDIRIISCQSIRGDGVRLREQFRRRHGGPIIGHQCRCDVSHCAQSLVCLSGLVCDISLNTHVYRQHWNVLRIHLGDGRMAKRTLGILCLLVESGVVYSALLVRLSFLLPYD